MSLLEQIEQHFKDAFKSKDEVAKSSLSNLKAALQNATIEKKGQLEDSDVQSVIAKKVKQHKDSITEFEKGDRTDLVEKESAQMQVLQKYLPKQMEESDVRTLVQNTIKDLNAQPSDFGEVMKEVMSRAQGQTDGSVVSKIVKEELNKS